MCTRHRRIKNAPYLLASARQHFPILALVVAAALAVPQNGFSQTQARHVGILGDQPFDFLRQEPPRQVQSAEISVRFVGFRDMGPGPRGNELEYDRKFVFDFEVEMKAERSRNRFSVSHDLLVQLDRMHLIDGPRLLLIGRFATGAYVLTILDLPSGRVLDRFVGSCPEISPDNRLIAFIKMAPLRVVDNTSAQYLIYDLSASPEANRSIQSDDPYIRETNVGTAIYPEGSRNLPDDNIGVPEDRRHEIGSDGFFWLDSRTLAFVDRHKDENNLVVVDLRGGLKQPLISTHPIDTRDAIDPDEIPDDLARRPERAFRVTSIGFADADREEVRIGVKPITDLHRPESRAFSLRLPEFRAPGAAGTAPR